MRTSTKPGRWCFFPPLCWLCCFSTLSLGWCRGLPQLLGMVLPCPLGAAVCPPSCIWGGAVFPSSFGKVQYVLLNSIKSLNGTELSVSLNWVFFWWKRQQHPRKGGRQQPTKRSGAASSPPHALELLHAFAFFGWCRRIPRCCCLPPLDGETESSDFNSVIQADDVV